jgi:putative transposase
MRYNPEKHHRRSIRLKGHDYSAPGAYFITICVHQRECLFGEVISGEMKLNQFGQLVWSHWQNLAHHHSHLQVDAFVVMPNHIHGILILKNDQTNHNGFVGAGLADPVSAPHNASLPKPALSEDVGNNAFSTKPALPQDVVISQHHSISEIIRGFKTFSARRINQIRRSPGIPVWQRNYHEHIIRDEAALSTIRQYITNNAKTWRSDQLHPNNPLKE